MLCWFFLERVHVAEKSFGQIGAEFRKSHGPWWEVPLQGFSQRPLANVSEYMPRLGHPQSVPHQLPPQEAARL